MVNQRLEQQIQFILEVDKLKTIKRQTLITDASRQENDAEHSWHLALMAMVLGEYAKDERLDVLKVIRMVLVHDLVEIDAGDTYCYDSAGYADKSEREIAAAERIFNLLPKDQATEFRNLWDEFESGVSAEARFANALDRLQPLLNNVFTEGLMWKKHGIRKSQVVRRNCKIDKGAPDLWSLASHLIDRAVEKGQIIPDE